MRIVAFDIGQRYTGYAVSDPEGTIPSETGIIECGPEELPRCLAEKAAEKGAQAVVIGIPFNLKGEKSSQTNAVLKIVSELKEILDIPVYEVDERLTTVEAQKIYRKMGLKRKSEHLTKLLRC